MGLASLLRDVRLLRVLLGLIAGGHAFAQHCPEPGIAIVIFDSQASIGARQGVYMTAEAQAVTGADIDRGIEVFSHRSLAHGGPAWTPDEVRGEAPIRLYRATASAHSILAKDGKPDHRIVIDIKEPAATQARGSR